MKLPISIYIDLSEDEEKSLSTWLYANQALVIEMNMEACWRLARDKSIESVDVISVYDSADPGDTVPVFEISVQREDVELNLSECESYFVENEEYERAAETTQCRKLLKDNI
jgi:hypothetical protein